MPIISKDAVDSETSGRYSLAVVPFRERPRREQTAIMIAVVLAALVLPGEIVERIAGASPGHALVQGWLFEIAVLVALVGLAAMARGTVLAVRGDPSRCRRASAAAGALLLVLGAALLCSAWHAAALALGWIRPGRLSG